jgi:hypothetical protein
MHENRILKKNYKCFHSLLWLNLTKLRNYSFWKLAIFNWLPWLDNNNKCSKVYSTAQQQLLNQLVNFKYHSLIFLDIHLLLLILQVIQL